MSVNINFVPSTNETKWATLKSGDYVVLENTEEHPIPCGLYRVFRIADDTKIDSKDNIFIVPLFDGDFNNMFPYLVTEPYPKLNYKMAHIKIEAEVSQ